MFLGRRGVQGEHRHPSGDGEDDEVFVPRVPSPKQRNMQKHDGQQFTRFRQDKCDIIDMRQTRIPKRTRQTGRQRHSRQGESDCAAGEDGGGGGAGGAREVEVREAGEDGEEGLDCV